MTKPRSNTRQYRPEDAGKRLTGYLHDREVIGNRIDSRRGDLAAELADLERSVRSLPPEAQEIVRWFIFKGHAPEAFGTNTEHDKARADELRAEGKEDEAARLLERLRINRYPRPAELRAKIEAAIDAGEDREVHMLKSQLKRIHVLTDVAKGMSSQRFHDLIRRTSGRTCRGNCKACTRWVDSGEEIWYDRVDHSLRHLECPGELPVYLAVPDDPDICKACGGRINILELRWYEPISGRAHHIACR